MKRKGINWPHTRMEPAVDHFQEVVRAAAAGKGRPQLAPHKPVAHHQHGRHDPGDGGLRPAHGGDKQGDRDERADPHHVGDVERNRLREGQAAREGRRRKSCSGSRVGMAIFGQLQRVKKRNDRDTIGRDTRCRRQKGARHVDRPAQDDHARAEVQEWHGHRHQQPLAEGAVLLDPDRRGNRGLRDLRFRRRRPSSTWRSPSAKGPPPSRWSIPKTCSIRKIVGVTPKAEAMGIHTGVTGREAVELMLKAQSGPHNSSLNPAKE